MHIDKEAAAAFLKWKLQIIEVHYYWHRHKVAYLCVFFKIDNFGGHPARIHFPALYVMRTPIHGALAAHFGCF